MSLLALGPLGVLPALAAQNVPGGRRVSGLVLGSVTDSSLRPVPGADVSIALSNIRVVSDDRGKFELSEVPPGTYLLTVRRLGFGPVAATVAVPAGDTVRPVFILESAAVRVAGVNVTAHSISSRRAEFEERRRHGNGEFFDQVEIEAKGLVSASDILRQAKSVRIVTAGTQLVAESARQWTKCPLQVYVDGVPLAGLGRNTPFDLNLLPSPKEIMGIEIYSGPESVPLWLPEGPQAGKRGCGAILVWTRDDSAGHI